MSKVVDEIAKMSIQDLMNHYKISTHDDLIRKAISTLKITAYIDMTKGELIARKNGKEVPIII